MVAKMPRGSRAYVIREPMFDDLDYIAANLSSADAMEPQAASGHRNYRGPHHLVGCLSTEVRTTESNGLPILGFSIARINEEPCARKAMLPKVDARRWTA